MSTQLAAFISENIDNEDKFHKLVALLPKEKRGEVRSLIKCMRHREGNSKALCEGYYARVQKFRENSEQEMRESPGTEWRAVEHVFSIRTEDSVTLTSGSLGPCIINYNESIRIMGGHFEGGMSLKPGLGGLAFVFLNGLPEGSMVRIFLNWSIGPTRGTFAPESSAIPRGILVGHQLPDPDFQWSVVESNRQAIICVRDDQEIESSGAFRIALGADCHVSCYST